MLVLVQSELAGPVLSADHVVPVVHVCGADILYDLWDEHGDFRTAFVLWAERLTAGYDAAYAAGALPSQVAEPDMQAITELQALNGVEFSEALREQIAPLHGDGITLRKVADLTDVPLRLVVAAVAGPRTAPLASVIADAEEALVSGGQTDTTKAMAAQYGVTVQTLKLLAKAHGIVLRNYLSAFTPMREMAQRLMVDDGMSPSATLAVLRDRFPHDAEGLSLNTVSKWKARAKR